MLGINDLKIGTIFVFGGEPHEVLEARHLKMQMRKPVLQTRLKNLINLILLLNYQKMVAILFQ